MSKQEGDTVDQSNGGGISSRQRALLAFVAGAASLGGASSLGHQAGRVPIGTAIRTRGDKLLQSLVALIFYAALGAGLVVGWHERPGLLGICIGMFIGLGIAILIIIPAGAVGVLFIELRKRLKN